MKIKKLKLKSKCLDNFLENKFKRHNHINVIHKNILYVYIKLTSHTSFFVFAKSVGKTHSEKFTKLNVSFDH